jgi:hypothetical protein
VRSRPLEALRQGLLFLASRDLHLAAALARRFYWSDLNLWPDDLPPGSVVLLSGQDDLVAAQDVQAMLEKRGNIKVGPGMSRVGAVLGHWRHLLGRAWGLDATF